MLNGMGPFCVYGKGENMKTIGSIKDLLDIQCEFAMHILLTCPWLAEPWNAKYRG